MNTMGKSLIAVAILAALELGYVAVSRMDQNQFVLGSIVSAVAVEKTDDAFIRTMIERQRTALALVAHEVRAGSHPDTRKLAQAMFATRERELQELSRLQASLP
jgi:uncharacterized protein (DUF305 family)